MVPHKAEGERREGMCEEAQGELAGMVCAGRHRMQAWGRIYMRVRKVRMSGNGVSKEWSKKFELSPTCPGHPPIRKMHGGMVKNESQKVLGLE